MSRGQILATLLFVSVVLTGGMSPRLLWQVHAVENFDFIVGSATDFTLSTVVTFQFGS